jgi:hypothetical protein
MKNDHVNARAEAAYLNGELGYLVPPRERPYNYMYEPPPGVPRQNCEYESRECRIHNARALRSALGLEATGFELLDASSGVRDFSDEAQVTGRYYRELEALALNLTGGVRAIVFDHQRRKREAGRPALSFGREGDGTNPAALGRVHNDYTEVSGPRRRAQVLPGAAADQPFMILNFWRAIVHPAIDTPLAVGDARSFPKKDWVASDLIYPERTGEIYLGLYSAAHRWYYYPEMQPGELLVFKSFDSRIDHPVRMTPHCAFDDPGAPPDAPLRQSIEARCLVILE